MSRKVVIMKEEPKPYGIRVTYPDGSSGWVVGQDKKCMAFASEGEAVKAMRRMKRDTRYTWNCTVEVAKLGG